MGGDEHKFAAIITCTKVSKRGQMVSIKVWPLYLLISLQTTEDLTKSKEQFRDLDVTVMIVAAVKERLAWYHSRRILSNIVLQAVRISEDFNEWFYYK